MSYKLVFQNRNLQFLTARYFHKRTKKYNINDKCTNCLQLINLKEFVGQASKAHMFPIKFYNFIYWHTHI